ncbi:hypothetical protein NEUTE1DRAFT_150958 [Neurospora tetrasperma FGSC 2508]|uniref:Fungal N-terminal domain-containing protein n=1 Tax=Neurospora tetrasperma (strain FGSC 2508 / ATCC MYA-4615 / P0657) TaxID=510951 RepID=F8MZM1_NEUT8|nr:uncharacterized protein NEUTE1DRAFT_150958 [Neurospora tetrasperma FGSC 2508]EGO53711.1 hypothetical protein NEUTE1DRAFT_150958 [Neurospora tetrasperma FGSC 2508]
MSGIEVVGLVLGILPLAAKALQSYLGFVSSVRKVDSDLHNLLQDLKVEDTRLRNSCRQLLNDIIPFDSSEGGVGANPFSPELSLTVRNKLRLKLYDSYPMFEQTMTDMQAVAADLRLKLSLQENGTAVLKDKKSIIRQLKAKTGFTLRKKDYDATMLRLKSANAFLETLTSAGTGQYTSNKRRSDYRVISLLRKLVKSLFNALQNAATDCRCPVSHNACLELVARNLVFIHNTDIEEQVAKDIDFHVTLSSGGSDLTQERLQLWPRWTSFRLQCGDPGAPPPPAIPPKSTTAFPCPQVKSQTFNDELGALSPAVKWATELLSSKISGQSKKRPKRVSFAPVSQSAAHTLIEVSMASLAGLSLSGKPERQTTDIDVELTSMLKICQLSTHNKGKKRALVQDDLSHGCIIDAAGPRTFRLYPPRWKSGGQFRTHPDNSEFTTSFTLRQLLDQDLQGPTGGLFRLEGPLMKLRISHAIAASLLYIYDTPWLSQILTLDSIVFFLDDNSHVQLDQLQPFRYR